MNPEQPVNPTPGNNYDFILNPSQPPKPKIGGDIAKDPLIKKLLFVVGGAVLLIVVSVIVVGLFFSSKTNVDDTVSIVQTEQEIIRLGEESKNASDQATKNAALNTKLSLQSQQRVWQAYLSKHGRSVEPVELSLKKNAKTDQKLTVAKQNSTFDTTYTTVMREQLEAYSALLKSAYDKATSKSEREQLNTHFVEVSLLLKQWPAVVVGLASY